MASNLSNEESDFSLFSQRQLMGKVHRIEDGRAAKLQNGFRMNWSQQQNRKYYYFLEGNRDLFRCYRKRREHKVFCLLGMEIKTRTINQIKSHHQKMIKKHLNLEGLLLSLRHRLFPSILQNNIQSCDSDSKNRTCSEQPSHENHEESLQSTPQELELGIANNFPTEDPLSNHEWFIDL